MITLRAIAVGLGLSAFLLFFSVGAFAADYTKKVGDEFLDTMSQGLPTIAEVAKDFFKAETCGGKTIKDFTIEDFYKFVQSDPRAAVFILLKYSQLPLNFPAREVGRTFFKGLGVNPDNISYDEMLSAYTAMNCKYRALLEPMLKGPKEWRSDDK